jgi:hypothetical protein
VDGRRHPRREGIIRRKALQKDMEVKAVEFVKQGTEIYKKA